MERAISPRLRFKVVPVHISAIGLEFCHLSVTKSVDDWGRGMRAAKDDPHRMLARVLTEPPAGYRRWMGPADIIEQSRMEHGKRKPVRLADLLRKLVRRELKA